MWQRPYASIRATTVKHQTHSRTFFSSASSFLVSSSAFFEDSSASFIFLAPATSESKVSCDRAVQKRQT